MRKVVVTGLGVISPLGNTLDQVTQSLQRGLSAIVFSPEYQQLGFDSQVYAPINIDSLPAIPRKLDRFMGDAARYAYHATQAALLDAQLPQNLVSDEKTALIVGSGAGSLAEYQAAYNVFQERGIRKVPPYIVPRIMSSTVSANLAQAFAIVGPSHSITAACATGGHCIGQAAQLIQAGYIDRAIVGAAEELSGEFTFSFDAMGALSSHYNHTPQLASRPFDQGRDGFVISGGAGILILEEKQAAEERGAQVYAEVVGYGSSTGLGGMAALNQEGAVSAMRQATQILDGKLGYLDYINAHATATDQGDASEAAAILELFADHAPAVSSTKGMTGHSLAAAGAHEAIYTLLMMRHQFIAPCVNLTQPDPVAGLLSLARDTLYRPVVWALSNSFGFGGSNASLLFHRPRIN